MRCGKNRSRGETCAISHIEARYFGDLERGAPWMFAHVMPLAEINNAFELMKRGESIRGVVTF
jgi:Zn-dependent alcohol dehydrogenase